MASARDIADARALATRTLIALEAEARSGAEQKAATLRGQLDGATRENVILKRAVVIQNSRHQARRLSSPLSASPLLLARLRRAYLCCQVHPTSAGAEGKLWPNARAWALCYAGFCSRG